jgi:hypothetical protein
MHKIIKVLVVIFLFLCVYTSLTAQNVEFQLGGKTNAASFEIKDSDGKVLFQLKGNGKVGIGTSVLKTSKFHVQGSINSQGVYKLQGKTVLSTKGSHNIFIGEDAGKNTAGSSNNYVGYYAGYNSTSGGQNNFVGSYAGYNNTGSWNSFYGEAAGRKNSTGTTNVFMGGWTGYNNTTGDENTFIGALAGYSNTTGNYNVFLGKNTGYSNTTGNSNVFLGHSAGYNETGSNKLYIDNSSTGSPLIWGNFSTDVVRINGSLQYTGSLTEISDFRYKKDILPIHEPLASLSTIKGVMYTWKQDEYPDMVFNHGRQIGVIAQDVEKVYPEIVYTGKNGYKSVDYTKLTAVLIEAVKEQQQVIDDLKTENKLIKDRLKSVESLVQFSVNQ